MKILNLNKLIIIILSVFIIFFLIFLFFFVFKNTINENQTKIYDKETNAVQKNSTQTNQIKQNFVVSTDKNSSTQEVIDWSSSSSSLIQAPEIEEKRAVAPQNIIIEKTPQISGWIAWWREEEGLDVVNKYKKKIYSISPGWFNLNNDGILEEIGGKNKTLTASNTKSLAIKLYPMLITDLSDKRLSNFIKKDNWLNDFADQLIIKLKKYEADGLDLDFENIGENYSSEFSLLIKTLSKKLKKNNLKFSIAIQAQDGINDWSGLKGQDLNVIGQYVDEARIMIYDNHTKNTKPGPIAPMTWFKNVIKNNLQYIPLEKISIGLPTYGYVWINGGEFFSFQYNDFLNYAKKNNFTFERDPESFELLYKNKNSTGWLSDSETVIQKIKIAEKFGLNKFIIWNLSGTDEKLFEKEW